MNATRLGWLMRALRMGLRPANDVSPPLPRASDRFQVDGLRALGIWLDIERYALAFRKDAHAGGLDCGDVHKHVFGAAFGRHKAKSLACIEEFHCSGCHGPSD